MKRLSVTLAALFLAGAAAPAISSEYKPDEEEEGHVDAPTYRLMLLSPGDHTVRVHMERDIKYVDEMSEHHRGAVRMSEAYLNDPQGTNPFLRRMANAIIFNQRFEIGWLADIKHRIGQGSKELMGAGNRKLVLVPQGLTGMEHRQRFTPAPILSVTTTVASAKPYSEFDIQFAKGMKMHHEMALEMAHAYNNDPAGGNRVIKEINLGILADQAVEIGLLENVIDAFDGDAAAVEIPPEMHDMMGMPMNGMDMQHQH